MNSGEYLIVLEPTAACFSSYRLDLPGCITPGETVEQTGENMREAIELNIEGLIAAGEHIPSPRNREEQVNTVGIVHSGAFIAFAPHEDHSYGVSQSPNW